MRKLMPLFLIMALLFTLAGCGSKTTASSKHAQKVKVILDWTPNTNHTGLYAAKDQGYYAAEGLDVDIVQPSDGGTAQLIAAGKGDFGISYQEEVTTARSQNIPVVAIAAVIQHNTSGFASPVAKNIKTPKDFEGKTYGGWGSPSESAVIKAIMEKQGADFSKVKIVNIGSADFFTSVRKNIDFAWIFQGWTGIEAQQKHMQLNYIPVRDLDPVFDYYTPVIIASEKTLSENPELAKKFMRATAKGYEFSIQHPDKAAKILLKDVPELNPQLVKQSQKYLANEYQADAPRWGQMKASVWKNYADFMYNNKLIDKNIDTSKAFTNKYLTE